MGSRLKAIARKQEPSLALLRKTLSDREEELDRFRRLLFAIVKHQGRIRFPFKDDGQPGERLDVRIEDGEAIVSYVAAG